MKHFFVLAFTLISASSFAADLPKSIECSQRSEFGNGPNAGHEVETILQLIDDGANNREYKLRVYQKDKKTNITTPIFDQQNLTCQFVEKRFFPTPENFVFSCDDKNNTKRIAFDFASSIEAVSGGGASPSLIHTPMRTLDFMKIFMRVKSNFGVLFHSNPHTQSALEKSRSHSKPQNL